MRCTRIWRRRASAHGAGAIRAARRGAAARSGSMLPGRTLFYGMGTEVGAEMLARGMQYAGAVAAAQLDINWSWTKFLLMGQPSADAPLQVTSTLIPLMVHARNGYVERSAARDFFYIGLR